MSAIIPLNLKSKAVIDDNEQKDIAKLQSEDALIAYMKSIKKYPMLKPEEEAALAQDWYDNKNTESAHKLVTSHLRLVAKIAFGYRGYGLPTTDLIAEGNIGLMQAVKKFEPKMGFRLATYAIWWIKASINEYILHSWSLVKIGTTAAQKKLFFNLKKFKSKIQGSDDRNLTDKEIHQIAEQLNVSTHEVANMEQRIAAHDSSLNAPISHDDDHGQIQDFIIDENNQPDVKIEKTQMDNYYRLILSKGMQQLNPREQDIIKARYLIDEPETLEDLANQYHISRERVRQIEARALEKIKISLQNEYANL